MSALPNTFVHLSTGLHVKSGEHCSGSTSLALGKSASQRKTLVVRASYSDGGRSSSGSLFLSGFVLGGLIVGALGCVYAPQIKAVTDTDKKDLMNKLPKFIYDEEKVVEKKRKKLAEKIEQLNSDIDNVPSQLRSEEEPLSEAAVSADDIEAATI